MSATLLPIDAGRRPLADHAEHAGEEALERIRSAAAPLAGARIVHVTAAASSVSHAPQRLRSLLALLADAGLEVSWLALAGGDHARVGEWLEHGLAGGEFAASAEECEAWLEESRAAAADALDGADLVVVHDAAALGVRRAGVPAVWSRGQDLQAVTPEADAVLAGVLDGVAVREARPVLDPLGPRSHDLPRRLAGQVLRSLGLDLTRPIVCQTGAIDRWTDPHTAVDAFEIVKQEVSDVQLVIAGTLPGEGAGDLGVAKELDDYAAGRPDVHVKTGYGGVGNVELNAINHVARVALSVALRPDTGPSRLEAWWKGTPVVASEGGPLAVRDGQDGFSATDVDTAARRIGELVGDPGLAVELGAAGRRRARASHLVTHAVEDEIRTAAALLGTVAG